MPTTSISLDTGIIANWALFCLTGITGWSLMWAANSIVKRSDKHEERLDQHDERLSELDHTVTTIEAQHKVFCGNKGKGEIVS